MTEIIEQFNADVSNDWKIIGNYGDKSVSDGWLVLTAPNTSEYQALIAPYLLSNNHSIETDIKCTAGDVFGSLVGYRAGLWLRSADGKNWVKVVFEPGTGIAVRKTTTNEGGGELLGSLNVPMIDRSGSVRKLKIAKSNDLTDFFVDGQLIVSVNIGFSAVFFGVLSANGIVQIDNLIINGNQTLDDLSVKTLAPTSFLNLYTQNEQGSITGLVKETGLPENAEVGLYDRKTRQLIALTRSVGGAYSFIGIDKNREYYVHAIDDHRLYNAVTQDMLMGNYDELRAKGQI